MRILRNIVFISITALFIFGAALYVKAQTNGNSFITNPGAIRDTDINVDLIPEVPGPNQNVKINLSSFATNINKAAITWSINGTKSVSGVGKTSFSFTTGDIGSKTVISISLIVEEGSRVDKIITIQPSQVDLLWEASESYVPPFYKGKALAVQESRVKVVALPLERDGSIIPENKVYSWKKNFVIDQNNSGYGKNAFIVKNSYLDHTDTASVSVSNQSGSGSVNSLTLNYTKPLIMVYEKSPAYGLRLNKLLNDGLTIKSGEISLSAEPFYFSRNNGSILGRNMEYKWIINNTRVTPPQKLNEMTLRGNNQVGTANIALTITNLNTLFQEARQTINVTLTK